jgi:hypothetical protein
MYEVGTVDPDFAPEECYLYISKNWNIFSFFISVNLLSRPIGAMSWILAHFEADAKISYFPWVYT